MINEELAHEVGKGVSEVVTKVLESVLSNNAAACAEWAAALSDCADAYATLTKETDE